MDAKERLRRLRLCFYVLEILTIIFSAGEKVLTYFCLTQFGGKEATSIPRFLIQQLGIIPALFIGFLATLLPILMINLGIRKFKLNSETHYWIWTVFMTVYFATFFKLFQHNLGCFGG